MDNNFNAHKTILEKQLTLKEWMIILLVLSIPIIGFVMVFIWAFSNKNTSKKTYCQALILYVIIFSIIGTILAFTLGASFFATLSDINTQNQQLTQELQQNMELSEKIIDAGVNEDASIVNDFLKEQNSNTAKASSINNNFIIDCSKLIVDEERGLTPEELIAIKGEPEYIQTDSSNDVFGETYFYGEEEYYFSDGYLIYLDYTAPLNYPWTGNLYNYNLLSLFNISPTNDTYCHVPEGENLINISYVAMPPGSRYNLGGVTITYQDSQKTIIENVFIHVIP